MLKLKSQNKIDIAEAKRRFSRIAGVWQKEMPDPKCELYFETPYQLLVSVILSAQATDIGVNKAMTRHYKRGFSPKTVLRIGIPGLLERIRTIGLAPTKAKNVYNMTKMLVDLHDGVVPESYDDLVALPGVGRKTANVVLAELFQHPTLAVDTHVLRVARRLGFHNMNEATKAEAEILKVLPKKYLPKAHHWFILHGRYTCTARNPQCDTCKIASWCDDEAKHR